MFIKDEFSYDKNVFADNLINQNTNDFINKLYENKSGFSGFIIDSLSEIKDEPFIKNMQFFKNKIRKMNTSMLNIIVNLSLNNKDQLCLNNYERPNQRVSYIYFSKSKASNALVKFLKTYKIYNIFTLNMKTDVYTIKCKTSYGDILEYEESKHINIKDIMHNAINYFIYTIASNNYDFPKGVTKEMPSTETTMNIEGLGNIKVNMPENATEETKASLNDFINKLRTGEIKLGEAIKKKEEDISDVDYTVKLSDN